MIDDTVRYFVTDPATGVETLMSVAEVNEFYATIEELTGLDRAAAEKMYVTGLRMNEMSMPGSSPVRIEVVTVE